MIVINILQWFLIIVFGFMLVYQLILTLLAFKTKHIEDFTTVKTRRFAIVVPAYNEEKVISKTVYSLSGLIYPKNFYDLYVIADNCTDNTAKVARNLGAIVLERANPEQRGKGYALRWAFDQIIHSEKQYDAIVVFDSDSLASGNYLDVMNYYLEQGKEVIQSSDLVIPQPGIWSSEATRIGFLLTNYVKPLGRKSLGLPMGLRGNGMCFSIDHLKKHPWEAWSLTEDLEYGLKLLIQDVDIHFAPEAYVWAQMPVNASNAESQRRRWEMGRHEIIRKYSPLFLKGAIRKRSLKFFDALVDLLTPPFVNTFLLVLIMIVINGLLAYFNLIQERYLIIWVSLAIIGLLHLFVGLFVAKADKNLYKSLFYVPIYILWKIKVYIKAFFIGREETWVRTTRDT